MRNVLYRIFLGLKYLIIALICIEIIIGIVSGIIYLFRKWPNIMMWIFFAILLVSCCYTIGDSKVRKHKIIKRTTKGIEHEVYKKLLKLSIFISFIATFIAAVKTITGMEIKNTATIISLSISIVIVFIIVTVAFYCSFCAVFYILNMLFQIHKNKVK